MGLSATGATLADLGTSSGATGSRSTPISAAEALERLTSGNRRYASGKAVNCNNNYNRRAEVAGRQAPFAIVLGCSDSRVPPEVIFDQRLGDLFVIRVAGNVLDDFGIGSIEYAVDHFKPPLLLVLGHEHCGAVQAAVEASEAGHSQPAGYVGRIVAAIAPAVQAVAGRSGDTVDNAVRQNVEMVARRLPDASPVIRKASHDKTLRIVGARYGLSDGTVTIIS
ncbi:MAG: carbonic anhydrase [Candidatus Eremiobacteraeota bacterium]|nr:carbonic anhydrase [Candidatus Eremiobacteraeota bacterium]MBC5828073.1 carbonic anhydrase [Candidatus Eremiobacteraeota bacterium]